MYTCIIVDDQTEAIELIRDHVVKVPELSLQLMTTEPIEALAFLDKNRTDIVFLDIEMPGITGIEFIDNLKTKRGNNLPKIVFTTGYSDYAMSGYEQGVVDYLLKPVSFSRFKKCTDRIVDELNKRNLTVEKPDFIFIEEDGKKTKINFEDITYVEGAGNYIVIMIKDVRTSTYKSLDAMFKLLPGSKFMRVHKSYIVAIDKVHAVRGNEIFISTKDGEKCIPIGVTFKENVLKQLGIN